MKKKENNTPVINIPCGYRLEDVLDMDDSGFDFEDAILYEEVSINFERENGD